MLKWTSSTPAATAFLTFITPAPCLAQTTPANTDFKAIAEEAFIYAYPMVMAYGIMYDYSVDKSSSQYKGEFNRVVKSTPSAAPKVEWIKINKELVDENPFNYLNFVLQFAPTIGDAAVEIPLRERFASIGIVADKPFPMDKLTSAQKADIKMGIESALGKIKYAADNLGKNENGWRVATSRLYWPKEIALQRTWQPPAVTKVS